MARPRSPHGTYAAYQRHLREKTEVCADCRSAQKSRQRSNPSGRKSLAGKAVVTEISKAVSARDLSRLEVLRESLDTIDETVAVLKSTEPGRLYLLLKERRETVREIAELQGNKQPTKGVTLQDELAAAREKRNAERQANA